MKPIKLTMSAFGPYKDIVTIDFQKINDGLLLITGPTGSGKTSIFDAICFALYGEASGSVRESNSLRSDYASPDTKTFVHLTFSHDNVEYNIERSPKYLRHKSRGEGFTEEPSTSYLTGPNIEISNNNEVTDKITEILGLDYKQFKQISMLSQGEFAKLLLAHTDEKTAIFRKIFDTSIFSSFSLSLKQKASQKRIEYDKINSVLKSELDKLDFDYSTLLDSEILETLNDNITKTGALLQEQKDKIKTVENKKNKLEIDIKLQDNINKSFIDLRETKLSLNELEINNKNIKGDLDLLEYNKMLYHDIKPYYDKVNELDLKIKSSKKEIDCLIELIKNDETKYKIIMDDYQNIDNYKNRIDKLNASINDYKLAIESIKKIKEYNGLLISTTSSLDRASKKYLDLNDKYTKDELLYYNSQAGLLASHLAFNAPCPVCGSTSHPKLASLVDNVLSDTELKMEKDNVLKLLDEKNQIINKIEGIKSKIDVESTNINKVISFDIDNIDNIKIKLVEKLNILNSDKSTTNDLINSLVNKKNEIETSLSSNKAKRDTISHNCDIMANEYKSNNDLLNSNLKSNITSIDEYKSKLLNNNDYNNLDKKVNDYNKTYNQLISKIDVLTKQVDGKKEVDITKSNNDLNILKNQHKELSDSKDNSLILLDKLNNSYKIITKLMDEIKDISHEYNMIQLLSDTANGTLSGKQRINFENYVQSSYLNTVLVEANKRLSNMSDSRFTLKRKDTSRRLNEKLGLEFVVFDSYTGKEREVSTLSGGESFKASLSLALGLSDVIQMYAGGIKVEALFIDEGFGTLDSESIEQALNTLYSLSENNRLIGIISHVEELISRIDNKIVIKKTNTGSSIEVKTN